jgi:hypothetical protein
VAGAAVGSGLAEELCRVGGLVLCVAGGLALCVAGGLVLGGAALDVRLGCAVEVAEVVAPGENFVGVGEGEDPAQAETDVHARMATVAQPTAVSRGLSPVRGMVRRI